MWRSAIVRNFEADPVSEVRFRFLLLAPLLVGFALRLHGLSDQVILDDEWHGLEFVTGRSFGFLLTHFGIGATCIPLNLYRFALFHSIGWSEVLLKLPAIIPGLFSLLIFPFMVKRIFGSRIALLFTWLLAIAPFLIFYSRVLRPYSMVAFLTFAAIWTAYIWMKTGERRYLICYGLAAVLAVYFHLFAAIAVFAPLGCGVLLKIFPSFFGRIGEGEEIIPSVWAVSSSGVSVALIVSLLIVPAFYNSALPTLLHIDHITIRSLWEFASMLSGTANPLLVVIFTALGAGGLIVLIFRVPLLGLTVGSIWILYFLLLVVTGPNFISAAIVISRYLISLFPLNFLLVAVGVESLLAESQCRSLFRNRFGIVGFVLRSGLVGGLILFGPLWRVYYPANNFTNHSAFQESYRPMRWDRSYESDTFPGNIQVTEKYVSSFYRNLASEVGVKRVIEYPMQMGDHFNLHYYTQHFHEKEVVIGYITGLDVPDTPSTGLIFGDIPCDYVFSRLTDTSVLRFRTMVDMADIRAIRECGAELVILHRYLSPGVDPESGAIMRRTYAPSQYLSSRFRANFGLPVFEDSTLVVFRIAR